MQSAKYSNFGLNHWPRIGRRTACGAFSRRPRRSTASRSSPRRPRLAIGSTRCKKAATLAGGGLDPESLLLYPWQDVAPPSFSLPADEMVAAAQVSRRRAWVEGRTVSGKGGAYRELGFKLTAGRASCSASRS